ncbi:MAG: valine--tRNA ligase [Gemmatimonadales bacterium]
MSRGKLSQRSTLPPQYDPTGIESALYAEWEREGLFRPASDRRAAERRVPSAEHRAPSAEPRPYVIMMPPPNVTAELHMGHGLNNAVQDVLIRFERMRGRDVLWLPGTDHAGIATQNVVERMLAEEGKTRFELGREAFVRRVWNHVDATGSRILDQLRALGASCDWQRTYFTLDDDLSRAVREVFVTLYEKGLIYRGKYIINWCPRCLTALSNEEVEKEETEGKLWHLRYPLADGDEYLIVATTRPETMLGDTAVAVHPNDARYRHLIGREVRLPLTDRTIPVIADSAVDPDFGTGAVKVTPAHDPLDFEIAQRHNLPAIDVMTDHAVMSDAAPAAYSGLDRFEARRRVVEDLTAQGLVEKVERHRHAVGRCYRCDTIVEPRLSDQWFVRMKPLAEPALRAYHNRRVKFIPEHRGAEYAQWMENIRDWCISRQLWWGHRIPVWYCDGCATVVASRIDLTRCPACAGPVRQDEDVLDTWFSSQLVPFSSLGWPERRPDLARFYPGDVLVTAPEILFFWVARMIIAGLEFMGEIPFHTVYLHGTVRDTQHRKMSKSLGNGIDPLAVIAHYGADALRYTVVSGLSVGTDLILDPGDLEGSFASGRNFANKLWNLGRFILSHLDGPVRPLSGTDEGVVRHDQLALADRWILARCEETVREATEAYERFRLNDAALALHRFLWSDLADWYLETIKPRLLGEQPGGDVARAVVTQVFQVALRLLQPIMPFITEQLWQSLHAALISAEPPSRRGAEPPSAGPRSAERRVPSRLMVVPWPRTDPRARDPEALRRFAILQEMVTALRSIRAEYNVPPGQPVRATASNPGSALRSVLGTDRPTISRLAKVSSLTLRDGAGGGSEDGTASAVLSDGSAISIPLGDLVDVEKECGRLRTELERLTSLTRGQEAKLANPAFLAKAPAPVVAREREKLAAWREQAEALAERRRRLGCAER